MNRPPEVRSSEGTNRRGNGLSVRWLLIAAILLAAPFIFVFTNRLLNGEKRMVGADVPAAKQVSIDQIDHHDWDTLLKEFVDEEGQVDYRRWAADSEARQRLQAYFNLLASADPDLDATKANRLAFWINAYNALTIEAIFREYPTSSIRNHTSRIGGYNLWFDFLLNVGGRTYSLNAIEHEILRKMSEPRIHFAIVCASKSCPRLLNQAFRGDALEQQLKANALHFFAQPSNFRVSEDGKTVYLSSILSWFGEDFGADRTAVWQSIKDYLPDSVKKDVTPQFRYLDYDWSLNGR